MKNEKLNSILPLVQRPGRYINHEVNSYPGRNDDKKDISVCLCFPDLYELGASNQGLEILYHIINRKQDAVAERCYSPGDDMEALLRKDKIPLFSLESKSPLSEFDIVGITLQYELCATNVLNMLDLAGIPLLSSERGQAFPLIIGGGPVTANPEPLADFFDAFVIGEGEDVICEVIDVVKRFKESGCSKKDLLLELAKVEGVYVPCFYEVSYNQEGMIEFIKPNTSGVPDKVYKRSINLEDAYYPEKPLLPYLQTVHNRLNVEIARGCPQRCRFCQASKYYWPYRMRSAEKVQDLIKQGLESTGYEQLSLSSLSCTDYKELEKLLSGINTTYGSKRIGVSLPSLRCDQFSLKVAADLGSGKRSNLTFAPEAGSSRLRKVIGKNLTQDKITNTLLLAQRMGWKLIKLYFMIGLPTETDADIEEIPKLVRSVKSNARNLNFNVSLSPFVPKAQTAFQWSTMAEPEVLHSRLVRLKKSLPASVKHSFLEGSILEGVLARGDRRISAVIIKAWEKGCRFDQWSEKFKYDLWNQAFSEQGIDPGFYLYRERSIGEILPWDHLVLGAEKTALWADYHKSLEHSVETVSEPAEAAEAVSSSDINPQYTDKRPPQPQNVPKAVGRVRLRFERRGYLRFISHLDQIEFFRRVMRRAGMPLTFTTGFHPQPKMSFGPAVSVGYESQSEYIEVELLSRMSTDEVKTKVQKVLPVGYTVLSARNIPVFFPSLDSLINVAEYEINLNVPQESIDRFFAEKEVIVEKKKKNRIEKIDVRPLVRELKCENGVLTIQLRFGPKKTVKPEKVLQYLTDLDDEQIKLVPIMRKELYIEKKDGLLSRP